MTGAVTSNDPITSSTQAGRPPPRPRPSAGELGPAPRPGQCSPARLGPNTVTRTQVQGSYQPGACPTGRDAAARPGPAAAAASAAQKLAGLQPRAAGQGPPASLVNSSLLSRCRRANFCTAMTSCSRALSQADVTRQQQSRVMLPVSLATDSSSLSHGSCSHLEISPRRIT